MPAEWLPLGMVGRRTARLLSEPLHIRYDRMNAIFEPPHLKTLLANYIGATPLMPPKMLNWQQQGTPLIKQLQQADFEQYMPSTVLVKVDRASMLNSLEVRAPLLDHELEPNSDQIQQAMERAGLTGDTGGWAVSGTGNLNPENG